MGVERLALGNFKELKVLKVLTGLKRVVFTLLEVRMMVEQRESEWRPAFRKKVKELLVQHVGVEFRPA